MRTCKKCGAEKELNADNFRSNGGARFRHDCRECEKGARAVYYAANSEKAAESARKWSKNNPEKRNATKRSWNRKNPDKVAAHHRKANYGITDADFQALFLKQNGACDICGFVFPGERAGNRMLSPHVDHCHTTGNIRGLLCHECNNLLARAKDSPGVLQSAIQYLLKSSK